MLIFNITNRHLNLEPVLAELIREIGMIGVIRRDIEENSGARKYPSVWAIAAQREGDLDFLQHDSRWKSLQHQPGIRLWTDDYSNILSVLKFHKR